MREGEIRLINLDPAIGAEIKKTRPAVVVSKDEVGVLPLKVVVPVTEWKPHYDRVPWMVPHSPSRPLPTPFRCVAFRNADLPKGLAMQVPANCK